MGKRKRASYPVADPVDSSGRRSVESSRSSATRAPKVRKAGDQLPLPGYCETSDNDTESEYHPVALGRHCRALSHIKPGLSAFPRSAYDGYAPLLPVTPETDALNEFKSILEQQHAQSAASFEYDFVVVEEFSAYRPAHDARRPGELAGLEKVEVDRGASEGLVFDGILRSGEVQHYVQGVPFKVITVDGYGDAAVTDLRDRICIQSNLAKGMDIWYQLQRPSKEYARFYEPFIWLAEFTKHFVDYLLAMDRVTLQDFKFCFHGWLCARHTTDAHFHKWLRQCNLRDFRSTVAAHVPYLWKECSGLGVDETDLRDHPLWSEVHPYNLAAIPEQANREHRTIVTPFVHETFKHMYFSEQLESRDVAFDETIRKINRAKAELGLKPFGSASSFSTALLTPTTQRISPSIVASEAFSAGDVVCLDADTDGAWKSTSSTWYAYVQGVRINERTGGTMLDALWMYETHHTTLGAAVYPFENELFLSDNCACGREAIDAEYVKGKVEGITWFALDPTVQSGFFVRQKFRTAHDEGTDDFITLQDSDFRCRCGDQPTDFEECRLKYDIGDTVLVKASDGRAQDSRLDPAIIEDFDLVSEQVVLRQLRRQGDVSNELVLTDSIISKPARHVVRACQVRTLDQKTVAMGLSTGYDRGGAGDFYYIIQDADTFDEVQCQSTWPPMTEGIDLEAPPAFEKLTGLGLFCGGGNFDRGLEDGGTVDFKYAVDWAQKALHTYRANSREPEKTHCFLGSVNDYLARALKGSGDPLIAAPGDIDLISAGSPCPGFSNLQQDKASVDSLRNASMVASVVSHVDLYCPQYCILENVVAMTAGVGKDKRENVFSQVIAAFVAMGYQVQQFLTDAWSHGSSQSRSRVFIVASAPGLEPFQAPQMTHDHPTTTEFRSQALGRSGNGKNFGRRRNEYTPFRCTTAAEATSDLPHIGDGQSRVCPSFPDHVLPSEEDAEARDRIASVPFRPHGMGLLDAVRKDLVTGKPKDWLLQSSSVKSGYGSKSYSRVRPDGLFPTVTTVQKIACGYTGRTCHWDQNRPLTVMELRRAMGFLDYEPIIGSPRQQVHIIGNSVDRKVSFALGLCLRESWSRSWVRRLAGTAGRGQLASPNATEDNEVGDDVRPEGLKVFNDMLRAGASAVAGKNTIAREALPANRHEPARSPFRGAIKAVDLTVDGVEDEADDRGDGSTISTKRQSRTGKPIAWVQIERRPAPVDERKNCAVT